MFQFTFSCQYTSLRKVGFLGLPTLGTCAPVASNGSQSISGWPSGPSKDKLRLLAAKGTQPRGVVRNCKSTNSCHFVALLLALKAGVSDKACVQLLQLRNINRRILAPCSVFAFHFLHSISRLAGTTTPCCSSQPWTQTSEQWQRQ